MTGATFSPCFMASTRTRGLIQSFDGRARRFLQQTASARSHVITYENHPEVHFRVKCLGSGVTAERATR